MVPTEHADRAKTEAARVVEVVALYARHAQSIQQLAEFAETAFDRYATLLLEMLLESADPLEDSARQWVRDVFRRELAATGAAIRDAAPTRFAGHAIAQALQHEMFVADARLTRALSTAGHRPATVDDETCAGGARHV